MSTTQKAEGESEHLHPRTMVVAKPVRGLAVVSAVLFLFLVYQAFKSPSQRYGPGELEKEMPNEPMLQGEPTCMLKTLELIVFRNKGTPRTTLAGRRLCCGQSPFSPNKCYSSSISPK